MVSPVGFARPGRGTSRIPLVMWCADLAHRINATIAGWKKLTLEIIKIRGVDDEHIVNWENCCMQMAQTMLGRVKTFRDGHWSELTRRETIGCFTYTYASDDKRIMRCALENNSFVGTRYRMYKLYVVVKRHFELKTRRYVLDKVTFHTYGHIMGVSKKLNPGIVNKVWYNAASKRNKWRIR